MSKETCDARWLIEKIPDEWRNALADIEGKEWLERLASRVRKSYEETIVYPKQEEIFKALELPPDAVRVVILGRDPYPQDGYACGLAFSAPSLVEETTFSLSGINRELELEGFEYPGFENNDLSTWAEQGVLLFNNTLTVERQKTGSHEGFGWAYLTNRVLKYLDQQVGSFPVFLLWGYRAKRKKGILQNALKQGRVLTASHPSYHSFKGCGHFKQANVILEKFDETPIRW